MEIKVSNIKIKTVKDLLVHINRYEELKDNLNIDLTKESYSFKEIYELAQALNQTMNNFVVSMVRPDIPFSLKAFEREIKNGNISKIKQAINAGYVKVLNDKLYFANRRYLLDDRDVVSKDVVHELFTLLISNKEYDIAKNISTSNLYYKLSKIDDTYLQYLLGKKNDGVFIIDSYVRNIYKDLEAESQSILKSILMDNYKSIFELYRSAKDKGLFIKIVKNSILINVSTRDSTTVYKMYQFDNTYEEFDAEDREFVSNMIDQIKEDCSHSI